MKYLFICIALFFIIGCKTSKVNNTIVSVESFKKYTYLIIGKTNGKQLPFGSCFFIKTKTGLLLGSANHVPLQRDLYGGDLEFQPDSFFIRICDNDQNLFCLGIDVSEYRKNTLKSPVFKTPDIFLFHVKLPPNIRVNSIEKFINYSEDYTTLPDSAFLFGFGDGVINGTPQSNTTKTAISVKKIANVNEDFKPGGGVYFSTYNIIDTNIYSIDKQTSHGFSGSPVFLKYCKVENNIKREWFVFGGIVQSEDITYPRTYIVKPKCVIDSLKANN